MWNKIFSRTGKDNANNAVGTGKYNDSDTSTGGTIDRLPRHVAIIMDGNGRWATAKGLVRTAGHRAGVGTLKKILRAANDMGIQVLTVYAFSTENWKRPAAEVDFLMKLFSEYLQKEILEMHEENVRISFIGDTGELSAALQKQMAEAAELTANNTGIHFNVAANYGGRDELVRVAKKIVNAANIGKIAAADINEDSFEQYLDTAGDPPVDLVIRTSGDMRLSNFLLWQAAYAEFWFTDTNWPDFTPEMFAAAINDFASRERRFGGV